MARRKQLAPDITIGEMVMLSHLCALSNGRTGGSSAVELTKRHGVSITVVRNVLARIASAIGPIEVASGRRRTLRPNDLGHSVGAVGFLSARLCSIARDPAVDQALLLAAVQQMTREIEAWHKTGKLSSKE